MKILHLEMGRHIYGGAKQVLYLLEGLNKHGVENLLVCEEDSSIQHAAKNYAQVLPITTRGDIDFFTVFKLIKIIRQFQPNLIHVHSRRGADWFGGIAARLTNTKTILSRRVDNPESRFMTRCKYALYNKTVAISQGIGDILIHQGLAPTSLRVIHSAVDTSVYDRDYDKSKLLSLFKLPSNAIVIGVIAQLIPRKGHQHLINVLSEVTHDHPNTRVIFFGQGSYRKTLESMTREKQLTERVIFAGFRDDLPELIGCLDIVVHPALMEGLGISLLQSAAAGVPLIGSDAGGIPEIVLDGKTGLLVEPADEKALNNALITLLKDKKLREKYGSSARDYVREHFSVDTMINGNLKLYRELLDC